MDEWEMQTSVIRQGYALAILISVFVVQIVFDAIVVIELITS